jgi:hypothetical protein
MAKDETARPPTTPYERFRAAVKQVLSVSKQELEKRETAWRRRRTKKKPSR